MTLEIVCIGLGVLFAGACVVAGILKSRLNKSRDGLCIADRQLDEVTKNMRELGFGYKKLAAQNLYGHDSKGRIRKLTLKDIKNRAGV